MDDFCIFFTTSEIKDLLVAAALKRRAVDVVDKAYLGFNVDFAANNGSAMVSITTVAHPDAPYNIIDILNHTEQAAQKERLAHG